MKTIINKKSQKYNAYGILNSYGQFWTPKAFDSEEAAFAYIEDFSKKCPGADFSKHTVVKVVVSMKLFN